MDLSINHNIFPLASSILANMKLSNSVSAPSTLIVPIIRAANSRVQVPMVSRRTSVQETHRRHLGRGAKQEVTKKLTIAIP